MSVPDDTSILDKLPELLNAVSNSNASSVVTAFGFLFAVCTVALVYKAVKSEPGEFDTRYQVLTYLSFFVTLLMAMLGPAIGLLHLPDDSSAPRPVSSQRVLDDLRTNTAVTRLIRLIPYTPGAQNDLRLSNLQQLGSPQQRFTFVADYDELRGDRVSEAVHKVGGKVNSGQHVSAIIFPLQGRQLFPANARGLLQIIQALDRQSRSAGGYVPVDVQTLGQDALKDLELTGQRDYWAWESYGPRFYGSYCRLTQQVRCRERPYSVLELLGGIYEDWHPLGFSFATPPSNVCGRPDVKEAQCDIEAWKQTDQYLKLIGTRAFLIENLKLSELSGIVLMDFPEPYNDRIPALPRLPEAE